MRILVVSLFVGLACLHAKAAETVTMEAARLVAVWRRRLWESELISTF